MGTSQSARMKVEWFKNMFKIANQKNISLDENKLIAQFCLDCFSTERKAKELLKQFETAGHIMRKAGEIASKQLFKEIMNISPEEQEILSTEAYNAK